MSAVVPIALLPTFAFAGVAAIQGNRLVAAAAEDEVAAPARRLALRQFAMLDAARRQLHLLADIVAIGSGERRRSRSLSQRAVRRNPLHNACAPIPTDGISARGCASRRRGAADPGGDHTGSERAAASTQRLLVFARRQPLDAKAAGLGTLLRGMESVLHRTLGEDVSRERVA